MSRPEYSNDRDLSYSGWHRTLPGWCYAMNLDWIEYRSINGQIKIVALIEDKDDRGILKPQQKQIMVMIAKALNVKAYFVKHNMCRREDHRDSWKIEVQNLITDQVKTFNELEYREFLINLK